jgi:hypothetical protein
VFAELWQAQAFALAVKLSDHAHFTWKEWAAARSYTLGSRSGAMLKSDGRRALPL